MLKGVDVSHHNTANAAPLDVDFAAVRLSYGMKLDHLAAEHVARFRAAGVGTLIGYCWQDYGPHAAPAVDQADFFLTSWASFAGEMGLALDVEPLDGKHPAPALLVRSMVVDFTDRVAESSGQPCLVYSYRSELERIRLPDALADRCPLWLSDFSAPWEVPRPWDDWTIVQTGVKRAIDRDEYRGDVGMLRAVLGLDRAPRGCALGG